MWFYGQIFDLSNAENLFKNVLTLIFSQIFTVYVIHCTDSAYRYNYKKEVIQKFARDISFFREYLNIW